MPNKPDNHPNSYEQKTRAVVYVRKSQAGDDRQALSIDSQTEIAKKLVEQYSLLAEYLPPEERSAHHEGRPVFNDMVDRIKDKRVRHIVCWKAHRLARNPRDAGEIIALMDAGQLLSIITEKRVYHCTSEDKYDLWRELAESKKYSDTLSDDVKGGNQTKYRNGEYPGNAIPGYRNVTYGREITGGRVRKNIEPHPEQSVIVHDLFVLASTGARSLNELYLYARDRGLRSSHSKPISKSSVENLLKRHAYTGTFYHGGSYHAGSYAPIIDAELFDAVQVAMGWRKPTKRGRTQTSGRFYPFKGVVICGNCKCNTTAYTKQKKLASGDTVEYTFYSCTRKSKKVKCRNPQLPESLIAQVIQQSLKDFQISQDDAAQAYKWLEQLYSDYCHRKNQYRPQWTKDRREAQEALEVLDSKLEKGVISDERYKQRAAYHQAIIEQSTKLLEATDDKADRWLELGKEIFSSCINLADVFQKANDEEKRKLMVLVGSNWTLRDKRIELSPREPIKALYKKSEKTTWLGDQDSNLE